MDDLKRLSQTDRLTQLANRMEIEGARAMAENLQKLVEEYEFSELGRKTVSLGVGEYINKTSLNRFLCSVDSALYEAKESGRNKVVTSKCLTEID